MQYFISIYTHQFNFVLFSLAQEWVKKTGQYLPMLGNAIRLYSRMKRMTRIELSFRWQITEYEERQLKRAGKYNERNIFSTTTIMVCILKHLIMIIPHPLICVIYIVYMHIMYNVFQTISSSPRIPYTHVIPN